MVFKNETELEANLRTQGLQISSIRLIKFGSIALADREFGDDSTHPYTERSDRSRDFARDDGLAEMIKLAAVLERHPNIFDFEKCPSGYGPSEFISPEGRLLFGPIWKASVHLPRAQQRYKDMDCVEHFSVFMSGTYFAAVSEVDSLTAYSNMAHEFREIFRSQVLHETSWKSPLIGPCPLHGDIFVVGLESSAKSWDSRMQFHQVGSDLYVCVEEGVALETVEDVFWECLQFLEGFYGLALDRVELLHIDEEIENRINDLAAAHSRLVTTSLWKIKTSQRLLNKTREELATIYQLRTAFTRSSRDYGRSRKQFLEQLEGAELVGSLVREMRRETILDVELPDSQLSSLQFFQAQADSKRGTYSILSASLVGALIGGLLTLLAAIGHHSR